MYQVYLSRSLYASLSSVCPSDVSPSLSAGCLSLVGLLQLTLDAKAGLALLHRHESILDLQQFSSPTESGQREAVRRVTHDCCCCSVSSPCTRSCEPEEAGKQGQASRNQCVEQCRGGDWSADAVQCSATECNSVEQREMPRE